ncbi:MAG: aryl-sulfate sulfotransferase [bacterium]
MRRYTLAIAFTLSIICLVGTVHGQGSEWNGLSALHPVDSIPIEFPPITVLSSHNPSEGTLFLSNFTYLGNQYGRFLIALDKSGNAVFKQSTEPFGAYDFRLQPNGLYTYFDNFTSKFYGLDSHYVKVDSFSAVHGYETDYRELTVRPDGRYAVIAIERRHVNMRTIVSDGDSNALVLVPIIQVFDKSHNLLFEWKSIDSGHFAITDATHETLSGGTIDCVHANSIDFEGDTALLFSSRNMDEVTKIDARTGTIVWRLGGKNNQFTFTNDTVPISHQHDVRRLPNGNITIFDNGNYRKGRKPYSRVVEYALNEIAKTATKVWEYRHTPDVYTSAMGSAERLPSGNTLVGWGLSDSLTATEVTPSGSTALEIHLPSGHYIYRIQKSIDPHFRFGAVAGTTNSRTYIGANYPNPFALTTVVPFTLERESPVTLEIVNALGRRVRLLYQGILERGDYSVPLAGETLTSGMYLCRLVTNDGSFARMISVIK